MAEVPEKEKAAPQKDEFVFVEHNGQTLENMKEELCHLQNKVEVLRSEKNRNDEFLDKFFQVFIAFTVLVTPIAVAFAFSHLSDFRGSSDVMYVKIPQNGSYPNQFACFKLLEALSENNASECAPTRPANAKNSSMFLMIEMDADSCTSSAVCQLRNALVFALIIVSLFLGLPYYLYSLDSLNNTDFMIAYNSEEDELEEKVSIIPCTIANIGTDPKAPQDSEVEYDGSGLSDEPEKLEKQSEDPKKLLHKREQYVKLRRLPCCAPHCCASRKNGSAEFD